MMLNFCTLFNTFYLSRGLAMYNSLLRNCKDFHLYIFPFDDACYDVLNKMNLKHVTLVSLKEFEDPDLLRVKPTRSFGEYCWTSTSSTILYVLKNYNVPSCTYIDADLYFFSDPKPLIDEIGDKSVIITEHNYTKEFDQSEKSGKYCVQFVYFKNDENGLIALSWWRDKCIDWCFNRTEDGKFGDQKYLDDWTTRFKGIHELQNLGGGLAPWNIQQFEISEKNKIKTANQISTNKFYDVIFYHFHELLFLEGGDYIKLCHYYLPTSAKELIYKPYLLALIEAERTIKEIDAQIVPHEIRKLKLSWKTPFRYIKWNFFKIENLIKVESFIKNNKIIF